LEATKQATLWPCVARASEVDHLGEGGTKGGGSTFADAFLDVAFEPGYLASRDRSELVSSFREVDACCAAILGIGPPLDQAGTFDDANHCRHRLLREMRSSGKLAHPQAVLFEQRDEHRSI
jgi:hypothetical protein